MYYLGTGTSFDVRSRFPGDYQKFTTENFIVCTPNSVSIEFKGGDRGGTITRNCSLTYTYSYSNGVLSIGGGGYWGGVNCDDGNGLTTWCTASTSGYRAYLVTGSIK